VPRTAPAPNIPAIPGMNPGILIKAGSGTGGGAGAGKGKGKAGRKWANGQGDEDNAEDGKKTQGDCGTGANGDCTNCGSNISKGDPVDVCTGEAYTLPVVDLYLPGTFALELRRSYASSLARVDVGMGYGWTHSLAWSLEERHREIIIRTRLSRVRSWCRAIGRSSGRRVLRRVSGQRVRALVRSGG
jgi:hypothetical protein